MDIGPQTSVMKCIRLIPKSVGEHRVKHMAVVQVVVGPVAGKGLVKQIPVVKFPRPAQKTYLLNHRQQKCDNSAIADPDSMVVVTLRGGSRETVASDIILQ